MLFCGMCVLPVDSLSPETARLVRLQSEGPTDLVSVWQLEYLLCSPEAGQLTDEERRKIADIADAGYDLEQRRLKHDNVL